MPATPTMSQRHQSALLTQLVQDLLPDAQEDARAGLINKARTRLRVDEGESRKEWYEHRVTLLRLAGKARIRVQDDLADAMELVVERLDAQSRALGNSLANKDGALTMTTSNFPVHVQLLLLLANQPDNITHYRAHELLHPLPEELTADQKLYREIMDEPFEGAHWRPSNEHQVGREEDWQLSSDDDNEPEAEEEQLRTPKSESAVAETRQVPEPSWDVRGEETRVALETVIMRSEQAYWKTGGRAVLDEAGTLGKGWEALSTSQSLCAILRNLKAVEIGKPSQTLSMYEMIREVLMALSGRPGIVFDIRPDGTYNVCQDGPGVEHYSSISLHSHLTQMAACASAASKLRRFVASTLAETLTTPIANSRHAKPAPPYKTVQAFAEACNSALQAFDTWLAAIEESSLPGVASSSTQPIVVTLSSLQQDLSVYHLPLVESLAGLVTYTTSPHTLLNHLYGLLLALPTKSPISSSLTTVFVAAATPLWNLLGHWLTTGMPIPTALSAELESALDAISSSEAEREMPIDKEYFVKRDYDVSWTDEEFWNCGFVVQEDEWPLWLTEEIRKAVLEGGKAIGLLRVLDAEVPMERWASLGELLGVNLERAQPPKACGSLEHQQAYGTLPMELGLKGASPHEVSTVLSAFLAPRLQLVQRALRRTLTEDCGMWDHLTAMEDILAARDGVVVQEWATWLFDRIDTGLPWTSFQLLNSKFRDAVIEQGDSRIQPSRYQIGYTGRRTPVQGVGALDSLVVDYEIPFPLSLQFTATSMRLRSDVFVLLLQLRYARHSLRSTVYDHPNSGSQHAMFRLRQKLMWITQTMWIFVMEHVIDGQLASYHDKIDGLASMEDLIATELNHARTVRDLCFLHPENAATRKTLLEILDMVFSLRSLHTAPPAREGADERACDTTHTGPSAAVDTLSGKLDGLITNLIANVDEFAHGPVATASSRTWAKLSFMLEDWKLS